MKRILATIALLAALSGCTSPQYVDVETFAGLIDPVAARHDAYVRDDPTLDETQRSVWLRSTELLRKAIEEARKK